MKIHLTGAELEMLDYAIELLEDELCETPQDFSKSDLNSIESLRESVNKLVSGEVA